MNEITSDDKPMSGDSEKAIETGNMITKTDSSSTETATEDTLKHFSVLSIIGISYAILNSPVAMASSLQIALVSGGASAAVDGIIVSAFGNLGMVLSLAEICHVYPLSGAGWVALTATASALAGSLITGMIGLANADYTAQPYQVFLIYVSYALVAMFLNIWGVRLLSVINQVALFWSMLGVLLIMAVTLATASKTGYQSAAFVFGGFENDPGYPNGVAWILGLLQSSFGLTAYDGVTHLTDEMPNPSINAPRAMVLAVLIGASSSFLFLMVLLFTINDVDQVISSSAGALLACLFQSTQSVVGALCLQVIPVVAMLFAAQGILTGSSRMTHAFAKDGGIPFSKFFSKMNKDGVPHNAVYLSTVLVIIFGLVYLGSSAALNAILSSSVVFLNISYCIPISLLLIRGRHLLRPEGHPAPTLTLGPIFGPICNIVGLVFTALTTVFFLFPPALPATGLSMNYAIVVVSLVAIFSTLMWIFSGSKHFKGPRNVSELLELAKSRGRERERNSAVVLEKVN